MKDQLSKLLQELDKIYDTHNNDTKSLKSELNKLKTHHGGSEHKNTHTTGDNISDKRMKSNTSLEEDLK